MSDMEIIDMSSIDVLKIQPETTADVLPFPAPAGKGGAITLDVIRSLAAEVGIPEPIASTPRRSTVPRATSASATPRVHDLGGARLPTTAALLRTILDPRENGRHDPRLAVAGWLLGECHLDDRMVLDLLRRSATTEAGAEDAVEVVDYTAARIAAGRPFMGSYALMELLGAGRKEPLTAEARATMRALEAALRADLGAAAIAAVAQLEPVTIEPPVGTAVPIEPTIVPTPTKPVTGSVAPFIDGAPGRTSTGALARTANALRVALILPPAVGGPVEVDVATQRAAIALAVAALLHGGGVPGDVVVATAAEAGVPLRADAVASAAAARPLPALRREAVQSLGDEWIATILSAVGADLRASALDEESARTAGARLLGEWAHRLTPEDREFLGQLEDQHPAHPAVRTIERARVCGQYGIAMACPDGHGGTSWRVASTDREVLCPHCHAIARRVYETFIARSWTDAVIVLRVRIASSSIPADDRERLSTAASRLRAVAEAPRAERRAMGALRPRWIWGREEFLAVVGRGLDALESDLPTLEAYADALRKLGHAVDGPRIVRREEAALDVVEVLDAVTAEAQRLLEARDPLLIDYEWLLPRAKRTAAVAPKKQDQQEGAPRPRAPLPWPTRSTKGGQPSEFGALRREVVRAARGEPPAQEEQQQQQNVATAEVEKKKERKNDGRCETCDKPLHVRMIDIDSGAVVGANAAGIAYTWRDAVGLRAAQRIRIGRRE